MIRPTFWNVVWRFIKPELEELTVYILVVLWVAGLAFYQSVVQNVSSEYHNVSSAFSIIGDKLSFLTDNSDTTAKVFTFGLWFLIGTIVYAIVWFLISFATGAFKDYEVAETFVHPRSFAKSNYWLAVMARVGVQVSAAISLTIYISLMIAGVIPAWLASFRSVFDQGLSVDTSLDFMTALIGLAFSLHIAAILLRLVLLRSKYSYQK